MARNSIILNGKSSNTITGLIIQELPPISKPLMRSQVEEIDGRDGDIITKLGFSAYDKEISVGLYGNFDINEIIAYFNSEGTVTFSNEPDKFYYYQILDQIDFERLVRFRTATINFHVQPFKYSTTEEAETIEAETVSGEGNNLVLENTSDAPFSKLTPKGDTFQQTYSGKNLCGMPDTATFTYRDVDITISNGEITLNGTASGTGYTVITPTNDIVMKAGTYTSSSIYQSGTVSVEWQSNVNVRNKSDSTIIASSQCPLNNSNSDRTFTVSSDTTIVYGIYVQSGTVYTNYKTKIQIVTGSTADYNYQQFVGGVPSPNPSYPQDIQVVTGEQTVKVTGKNLVDYSTAQASTAATTLTLIDNGFKSEVNDGYGAKIENITVKPSTTYTFSWNLHYTSGSGARVYINKGATSTAVYYNRASNLSEGAGSLTITTDNDATAINIWFYNGSNRTTSTVEWTFSQLEAGSTATTYQSYQSQTCTIALGDIELAKIGDYQDYIWKDGSDWKIHKAIGKAVLNGSESWSGINSNACFFTSVADVYIPAQNVVADMRSDYYTPTTYLNLYNSNVSYGVGAHNSQARILIRNKDCADSTALITWLQSHNTTVYYPLATPTDTAITDETHIAQLEALNAAHAYKGRTHIISTAGSDANLPHIIEAKVLGSSDTTITNAGNFISKPKFTIYGSGNIGLYINGIQILQIALGDEQYITIDAAQMEAYKDTLDNLKNRLVTGDYTNLALNPGENQISFSGSVEKYIVENYSRWL